MRPEGIERSIVRIHTRTSPGILYAACLSAVALVFSPTAAARSEQAPPARIVDTQRIRGEAPHVDGRLEDSAWNQVEWSGDFTQREPNEGVPPSWPTEFKVLYNDEALYFCFRMHDTRGAVSSILARRDWFPGDWIEVNIDSHHDFRTAYSFTLSLSGTRGDEYISDDGDNWDSSWDPIWHGATHIDDQGWTAEMKIPLSELRFDRGEQQVWGLQVHRRIFRLEERSTWQPIPKDISGWVSNFGEIHGLRGLRPRRRIEIMPYAVARTERFEPVAGDPYHDGSLNHLDLGLDGNVGLTSDFTLDFTVNPDFGQVEADPSEVNLTAFETFFSEKRPFFIEGADIFSLPVAPAVTGGSFTSDRLFYSRRIGKRPAHDPNLEDDEFAQVPENTSILGAVKLSGKTDGGLSVGILESVTQKEQADIAGPGGERHVAVEPSTNYFVGRVIQDLRGGDTVIGGMVTAVNRDISDEHLEFLRHSAYAGGVDVQHYFRDRGYHLEARVFTSHLRGSAKSILEAQTSSARYYQRPGKSYSHVDSARTTLSGSGGSAWLTRTGNHHNLMFQTGAAWRSPGFEINDLGYMRTADEINQSTWVGYRKRNPFSIFNNWALNANQWLNWDWGGTFLSSAANVNTNGQFTNRWNFYMGATRSFGETSNTALRGGPAFKRPGDTELSASVSTDQSKSVHAGLDAWVDQGDEDYFTVWDAETSVAVRANNALQISLAPGFTRNITDMQYVDTPSVDGEDRYVFGHLDQRTFALTFRLDYCLSPNLTLQYYGSPFISAGRFGSFKRVTDPMANRFRDRFHTFTGDEIAYDEAEGVYVVDEDGGGTDYTIDSPDFNVRDFNSNLVMRWEYQPGSTLFLVWAQSRFGYVADGTFHLGHDLDALFTRHPHNVFLVKFNQRFAL